MPPHRGPRLLVHLLAVAVVVGLLGGCEGLPQVPEPGPSTVRRAGETGRQNVAAIKRLGGAVDYGRVDPKTGQRSGIIATITPAMVRAASAHRLGSIADPEIRPPGYDALPARNRARGHLLGRQLGGSGAVACAPGHCACLAACLLLLGPTLAAMAWAASLLWWGPGRAP